MGISGLVITLNEEKHIAECLRSLFKVCEEVVVVDSNSTDGTVVIAQQEGAKVYSQAFLGDGPQRSYGLQFCKNDWILNLDADERLDNDLVAFLKQLDLNEVCHEAYDFRRKNFFHGKWIRVAGCYPDHVRRLFNRKMTDFLPVKTHSKILSTETMTIPCHVIHFSFADYSEMIMIMNRYSSWQAKSLFDGGANVWLLAPFLHGFWSFIMHYVVKYGFLGGLDGLTFSLLNSMGSYFKYAKLLELTRYGEKDGQQQKE